MNRHRVAVCALAAVFLAAHLPFLPRSLGDVDSINFALGIRDYDVAQHQPHPPGYPIFMGVAQLVNAVAGSELRTLALVSIVSGTLGVLALFALFRSLTRASAGDRDEPRPLAATLVASTAPLFWFTSARPLSDVPGLSAAVALQALIVRASSSRALITAALAAGAGAGIRSQVAWLTVPLLFVQLLRASTAERRRTALLMALAYAAGIVAWALPLALLTGGPVQYWRALVDQGAEDLGGVVMLWTHPSLSQLVVAFRNTFLLPWQVAALGLVVMAAAAIGASNLLRAPLGRRTLLLLAAGYAPYLVFDLLFQETATIRYALPMVVPVAYLVAEGAWTVSRRTPLSLAAGLAAVSLVVTLPLVSAYASDEAPAFKMLGDMRAADRVADSSARPVLAVHRRAAFDLRRPIQWMGERAPAFHMRLLSPPKREWLEVVQYWNGGGREPVWFVADPLRSDLALIDAPTPLEYRWPFDASAMLGGIRPNHMDWYVLQSPAWYLGEGWALTPETAGVASQDRRGPGIAPIEGWIRRSREKVNLVIGGRNLSGPPARVRVASDGRVIDDFSAQPGFFLRTLSLPPGDWSGEGDYARITVSADSDQVAIEQFDAQPASRTVFGFDAGWYEQEYNPSTGRSWRWASDKAHLRVRSGGRNIVVRLTGEVEAASTSEVTVKVGDRVVARQDTGRMFSIEARIPADQVAADDSIITVESTSFYVPAEQRFRRSPDRRRLALKIYECVIEPAS